MRRSAFPVAGAVVMIVLLAGCANRGGVEPDQGHTDVSLGSVDFPITCSEQAQAEFNRAVALLHHMTYPQARETFERVASIDPGCAMAQWGIAMTLFQPLWPTRPNAEALQRGWSAVQKGKELQPRTERERLFVAAAEAFFLEPSSPDYWLRIRRWENAMEHAYVSLPNDPEAAAFYALAHLATASSGVTMRAHADRAAEILASVYAQNPNHPGAMHYLVHANDVPGRERESLDVTRKYDAAAPRNPHALHMPTHIYTRLGEWDEVISGNLRAAEAALEHRAGEHREFVWDEFPHAIEYLVYAYLQKGMDDAAAVQLKRLLSTEHLEPTFKTAFHLASTQARYALERRAWSEAAALVPREPAVLDWNRFAWPEAIAHFARGLGAARLGDPRKARIAGERLEVLESATRNAGENLFATNIRVLHLQLNAWVAHAEGEGQAGIALMRQAAELEAATPKHAVTPAPTLPAEELLGDMLIEQGRPAEALASYRRALDLYPGRFNGLLGAARAARAVGDETLAQDFYRRLAAATAGGTRRQVLEEVENQPTEATDPGSR